MGPAHYLRVVLPFGTGDDLVAQYAGCITEGGIYLPVEPRPVRSEVQLEVQVLTFEVVLRASGVVSFVTAPGKRGHPGMGIRFTHLDEPSRALVRRACAGRLTDPQLPPLPDCAEMAEGEAAVQASALPASAPSRPPRVPGHPVVPAAAPPPAMPAPQASEPRSARVPKAPVSLKVRVPSQASLASTVDSLALTFSTRRPLPLWTKLDLEIAGPKEEARWHASGEVIASAGETLTVRLSNAPADAARVIRQLGTAGPPRARVDLWIALLMLSDEMLADVAAEMLCAKGIGAFDGICEETAPDIVAADAAHLAGAARRFPRARLIAVNLSGPDALVGDASRLKPCAFLKKPATANALVNAIVSQLHQGPGG